LPVLTIRELSPAPLPLSGVESLESLVRSRLGLGRDGAHGRPERIGAGLACAIWRLINLPTPLLYAARDALTIVMGRAVRAGGGVGAGELSRGSGDGKR
jgi:hypothetical protein